MSTKDDLLDQQAADLKKQKEIAELQKAIAEAQKAAAEARKATTEASLPKGATTPLAGDITVDGQKFGYLADLVAYQATRHSAQSIANAISMSILTPAPAKILIVGELNLAQGDLPLLQLETQLQQLEVMFKAQIERNDALLTESEEELRQILSPSEQESSDLEVRDQPEILEVFSAIALGPAFMAIPAVISAVADIASYFRVNYQISGRDVNLALDTITAVVAGAIRNHEVYMLNFNLINNSDIVTGLMDLMMRKQELATRKNLLQSQVEESTATIIERLAEDIPKLENDLRQLQSENKADEIAEINTRFEQDKQALASRRDLQVRAKRAILEAENLEKVFAELLSSITTAADVQTPSLLAQAMIRKHIRQQGITHLLHLKILSSGGEAVTKKSLWTSGETAFIGGSAITYVLATRDGQVVTADTQVAVAQLDYKLSAPGNATPTVISWTSR